MGYLGKISAIVSANTSDFSAKLAASGKEVQSWARSLNSAVNSASSKASSSLRGIYTEAQKAERALQAIQAKKIKFTGFDAQNLGAAVSRMQALISATKEVNEPLSRAARSLEKLPVAMQGGFVEAMKRAQLQAERLAVEIDKIGSGSLVSSAALEKKFEAIARRALQTAEAVGRLKAAAAGVDGLATGKEIQFRNPEFLAEMSRARAAQAQASAAPGGNFAGAIERQRAAADATAVAFAQMEESQLTVGGNVAGTTAAYERQLAVLKAITLELEQEVTLANQRTAASNKAVADANKFATTESDRRSGALARRNSAAFDDATAELMATPTTRERSGSASAEERKADLLRQRDAILARSEALSPDLRGAIAPDIQGLNNIAEAAKSGSAAVGVLADSIQRVDAKLSGIEGQQALREAAEEFSMTSEELAKTSRERGVFQPLGDLEKSASDLRKTQEEMRKLKAASDFGTTLDEAFETAKIGKAKAEIAVLQSILIKIGATTGNAAEAVDDFAAAWQRATSEVGGTTRNAAQLKQVADEAAEAVQAAVNASAAQSGGPAINVKKTLANAGDIGRFGADKFTLGVQQAVFAVDDFFSVTGDMQQRIRAVGNNLTQLGFVVGGTAGLVTALAASLAAQGVAALIKWYNNGRTAEDQTKSLNYALARQKSLVEELKQAFESLGDSIAQKAFSGPAAEARAFSKELDAVRKKQRELRERRVADTDFSVQEARADQARIEKDLEKETDPGRRVALSAQLEEARRREKGATTAAARARVPGGLVRQRVEESVYMAEASAARADLPKDDEYRRRLQEARRRAENAGGAVDVGNTVAAKRSQIAALEAAKPGLVQASEERMFGLRTDAAARADEQLALVENLLKSLQSELAAAVDELAVGVLEGAAKVAKSLEATQQLLDATLIPFSRTRAEADKAATALSKIVDELKTAEDPDRIAELEKQRAALEQQAAAYRSAAEVIRTFADTVKRISTDLADAVEGEARSAADNARRAANQAQAEMDVGGEFGPNGERRRPGDLGRDSARADLRRTQAENEARRAQEEADRVRRDNDRRREQFEANIANDPQVMAERKRLEELQATIDSEDATQEQKSRAAEEKAAIRRSQERRFEDSPEGRAAIAAADQADQAAARARERMRQEDEAFRAAQRGRDEVETPAQRAARRTADREADIREAQAEYGIPQADADRAIERARIEESERRRQEEKAMRDANPRERGRRLGMTDRERFRQDALDGDVFDARARMAQIQQQGGDVGKFVSQFIANQMEQVAPMLAQFEQERQTAAIGGPSRAALSASDVTTTQGMSELNRLLRGDDASKDVNLAELQKQTERLTELVNLVKNNPVPVL